MLKYDTGITIRRPRLSSLSIILKETSVSRIAAFLLGREINLSGKKIAPCSCCERASKKVAKACASPRDPKLSCYSRYTSMSKTYDIREINRMPLAKD
jgi:hypothetical protein